jgi:multimeric flavodoxin WrbA
MKFIILSGSPKGGLSVTLQYMQYVKKRFPQHDYKIFNISERIKAIERDIEKFEEITNAVRGSDGVIWVFPVYYLLVPYQYKRFIELIFENNAVDSFKGKHTTVITTSIHFFDHAAHNYMHAICDDLGMQYAGYYSADMIDLLDDTQRKNLVFFMKNYFESIESKKIFPKSFAPISHRKFDYMPEIKSDNKIKINGKKIILLKEENISGTNISKMVEKLKDSFSDEIEDVSIDELDIKGGCLGCLRCSYENECVYKGKDDFIDFFQAKLKSADIIIYAATIKDRYLSSKFKLYLDRSFYNNHNPAFSGKQVGFIISGPLSQIPNLKQALEAYVEFQQANLAGFITDEYVDSVELDSLINSFAKNLINFSENNFVKPNTFLGIGGMKVFRDDIWGRLRFPFRADFIAYKNRGLFDFPHKNFKQNLQNSIFLFLTKVSPSIRKEVYHNRLKKESIKPFQSITETK